MSENIEVPDPAAVFGCALSLWEACHREAAQQSKLNLSESYNGIDQLMREVMRIGDVFEKWACRHVEFDDLNDVWPYLLEDKFGAACVIAIGAENLGSFDDSDCLRVAMNMKLPVRLSDGLCIPIDLMAANPVPNSPFSAFRIQTIREVAEDHYCEAFTLEDDPFDDNFGPPHFALYGVGADGLLEHIADRRTYSEVLNLAQKLAPGVLFPNIPMLASSAQRNTTKEIGYEPS
jgi:hypothetical protein